jgi:transposase
LEELHTHLAGQKVTLLWDGLPSHRSKKMKTYLASQRRWLVVERLPAYAPELNPVEKLWANLKAAQGDPGFGSDSGERHPAFNVWA